MPNTNLSDPYISLLPMSIAGHKIITSPNNKEIYIIGGYLGDDSIVTNKILKADVPSSLNIINPRAFRFKEIPTKLKYARDGHVALPISVDIVRQICEKKHN